MISKTNFIKFYKNIYQSSSPNKSKHILEFIEIQKHNNLDSCTVKSHPLEQSEYI